mmetsp:Transcript_2375/g.3786  ORF Transcript_2375/g.3786 Transcript_2375/m.3786 type:complete len:212 (-) Transcript_2375:497-1132(-)
MLVKLDVLLERLHCVLLLHHSGLCRQLISAAVLLIAALQLLKGAGAGCPVPLLLPHRLHKLLQLRLLIPIVVLGVKILVVPFTVIIVIEDAGHYLVIVLQGPFPDFCDHLLREGVFLRPRNLFEHGRLLLHFLLLQLLRTAEVLLERLLHLLLPLRLGLPPLFRAFVLPPEAGLRAARRGNRLEPLVLVPILELLVNVLKYLLILGELLLI